jgi:hypothetical protein
MNVNKAKFTTLKNFFNSTQFLSNTKLRCLGKKKLKLIDVVNEMAVLDILKLI